MFLSQREIEGIQQLAQAAATLTTVTGADAATRGLLRHIEGRVNAAEPANTVTDTGQCSASAVPATVAERIEKIQQSEGNVHLQLCGLLQALSQDPETKLGDMKLIAVALGYKGVMLGMV